LRILSLFFLFFSGQILVSFGQEIPFVRSTTFLNDAIGLKTLCVYDFFIDENQNEFCLATDNGITLFDGIRSRHFTEKDGLPDSEFFLVRKDSRGRIWGAASNSKLTYIYNNKIYTSSNDKSLKRIKNYGWITSISEDSDSSIWFGSFSGDVFKLSKNNYVEKIFYYKDLDVNNRLVSNIYHEKSETFFMSSHLGLIKISKNYTKIIKLDFIVSKSKIINKNNILCTSKNRIFQIINEIPVFLTYSPKYLNNIEFIDKYNDDIYISDGSRIACYNISKKEWRTLLSLSGVDKIKFYDGFFLANSVTKGLVFSRTGSDVFYDFSENYSRSIFLDSSSQDIWVGGEKGKLCCYDSKNKKSVYTLKGTDENSLGRIFGINRIDKNSIGISFERNFTIFNNKNIHKLSFGSKCFSFNKEFSIIGFSNNCFIVRNDNIFNNKKIFIPHEIGFLPGVRVVSIAKINDSIFYLGTNQGLFKTSIIAGKPFPSRVGGFSHPIRYVEKFDNSSIWIYSDSYSLQIFNFKDSSIRKIHAGFTERPRVNKVRSQEGSKFWLCTDDGLYLCTFTNSYKNYRLRRFTTRDGLLSNEINDIVFARGKWWVATSKGLCLLEPDFYKVREEAAPRPTLHAFFLNGQSADSLADRELVGIARIAFSFGCLSFRHLGNLRFRYRLSPSSGWILTDKADHELNNLSPGDYRIEVQASTPNSPWSASLYYPEFSILPPFWQRTWVVISISAMLFSMVFALVYNVQRIRIARLQLESEMTDASLKSIRTQMKPHFLSNILNSMHYFILSEKPEDAGNFVSSFSRLVRHMLDSSDKNYLPLHPELSQLHDYFSFECKRMNREVALNIHFQKDADFSKVMIPAMLLQPLVENSLMHGVFPNREKEGSIDIMIGKVESSHFEKIGSDRLRLSGDGRLLIKVKDNGQGRDASRALRHRRFSQSYGMRGIADRLLWIRKKFGVAAHMEVQDLKDAKGAAVGTAVVLNLPLMETA